MTVIALLPGNGLEGGFTKTPNQNPQPMAKKLVSVKQPTNIEDSILLIERIILRNDGVLPTVPNSIIYTTLGALVGLSVPTVSGGTGGTSPPAPPGTHKIPEDIALPLRLMYPSLKRNFLDYIAVKALFATVTNNLQQQLGFADGQTLSTVGTARNLINRIIKSLLSVHAGNENELETYGFPVTVTTGGGPTTPPPTGGTTPP